MPADEVEFRGGVERVGRALRVARGVSRGYGAGRGAGVARGGAGGAGWRGAGRGTGRGTCESAVSAPSGSKQWSLLAPKQLEVAVQSLSQKMMGA